MAEPHPELRVPGRSGKWRPAYYWVVYAPGRGTKTHAQLETNERTICGREVELELGEEQTPGQPNAVEPNCRVCRAAVRRRARLLDLKRKPAPERLYCPRCKSTDMVLTLRENSVDRCVVVLDEGKLVYDVDGDPKRRVAERRLECWQCRTVVAPKDLLRREQAWPERKEVYDIERGRKRAEARVLAEIAQRRAKTPSAVEAVDEPF